MTSKSVAHQSSGRVVPFVLVGAVVVGLLLSMLPHPASAANEPDYTVSATTVAPGEPLTVSGVCFTSPPNLDRTSVTAVIGRESERPDRSFALDGQKVTQRLNADGSFVIELAVRSTLIPGPYRLYVDCGADDTVISLGESSLTVSGSDPRPEFSDVTGWNVHNEAIRTLAWYGITLGCSEGRFCPDQPISRQEIATLIDRADRSGINGISERPPIDLPPTLPAPSSSRFSDVSSRSTHAGAIERLASVGTIRGCRTGQFCPNRPVRRDETASLIVRNFENPGRPPLALDWYRDVRPNSTHATSIAAARYDSTMHGCASRRFCPAESLTREQAARVIFRVLRLGR